MPETRTSYDKEICQNDIREVNLDVKVVFKWSENIVDDIDESGNPVSYTSGFVMHILPGQRVVYNGEKTIFLAQALEEK